MRGAAAAFAWEFRRRLRWGLIALAGYLLLLAAVQFLLGPRVPVHPLRSAAFAFTVNVPLAAAFMFVLAVFTHGLAGDLAARQSMYPARLFTVPVSTAGLAGWPMLYGGLAMAGLWVAAAVLALRPSGVDAPLVWPALFAAAFLAWMQVFTWMPYGLPGLRVVVAVLWLVMIDAVVITAAHYELSEPLMAAIMAPQLPLAYLAARYAVARARRGDVPDWRGAFARVAESMGVRSRQAARFPSAAKAQAWWEWRQHGRSLPGWVAMVLPFELLLLHVLRAEPVVLATITVASVLLTPPFFAAFVAGTVGRPKPDGGDSYGLTPFLATRPLSTAALGAAKLRMALESTMAAWLLVVVALPLGLTLSATWPAVLAPAKSLAEIMGIPRASVLALLGTLALLVSTWKQLVQGLCIGLTGREALIKSSVLVRLALLVAVGPLLHALDRSRELRAALWDGLPWILALLACVKMTAAAGIATRLAGARLLAERALVMAAAGWLGLVLTLYAVLAWVFATPHIPHYLLVLIAVLAVPLARPALVPLTLAWDRHRGVTPPATGAASRAVPGLLAVPLLLALGEAVFFYTVQRSNGTLVVSTGERRQYLLHVPASYDPTRPTPLVISMHGAALWPYAHMKMTDWNAVADEHGFIVVYPSGLAGHGPRVWRLSSPDRTGDVRFIAELIDTLKAAYNIDPRRIYADGMSNGGGMAFALSCTLSDRIAAVGLVASAQFLPSSWCTDRRPVPMIAFHGTADRFTRYHGGTTWVAPGHSFPDIPTFTADWARRNQCGERPVESAFAADVTRSEYTSCANDATVALYTIHAGGHTWPGGPPISEWFIGRTTSSINASRQMWAFFSEHPLRDLLPLGPAGTASVAPSVVAR